MTTWAFVVCFAVWLMFSNEMRIGKELGLNGLEFGLLTSTPVLTGALFRLPLGIWTDRFGGRIVMFALLVGCAVPVWFASYANQLWQFLLLFLSFFFFFFIYILSFFILLITLFPYHHLLSIFLLHFLFLSIPPFLNFFFYKYLLLSFHSIFPSLH